LNKIHKRQNQFEFIDLIWRVERLLKSRAGADREIFDLLAKFPSQCERIFYENLIIPSRRRNRQGDAEGRKYGSCKS